MKGQTILNCFMVVLLVCSGKNIAYSQDATITINATQDKKSVSPYIYGCNSSLDRPVQFYKEVGLKFVRMNGGNNATKYNWRRKITSHPDWYNNVYGSDWDKTSQFISENFPDMEVMWAFQLLGRVASSTSHNFNDWEYNSSQWWQGVGQNLAGGGIPNTDDPGAKALVEGDIDLYTMEWPADSTVEILNHWFGPEGIGLDKKQFAYWNMDNEVDVWNGTHDDVMSDGLLPAAEFMDHFIEVAKKARAIYPDIKICGPVTTSEWQWYKWGEESIKIDGKYYCWLEYFIKRIADEEEASGIRLLDVLDLHNYPYAPTPSDALQLHRMYYDKNYVYPGANGVKTINGGWENTQTKEYIFQRIEDWLAQYLGEDHGIKLGISEWGPSSNDPNICSVVYGSLLGTFANRGVEYLTPWSWEVGMWETLHLFSRYAKEYSVSSTSSLENNISAYTTVNETADSMTIILVNRDMNSEQSVTVDINDFPLADARYGAYQLASLPSNETFVSHSDNALTEKSVLLSSNSFTIMVPALSTTAIIFPMIVAGSEVARFNTERLKIYPNPACDEIYVRLDSGNSENLGINIYDQGGRRLQAIKSQNKGTSPIPINISGLAEGYYIMSVISKEGKTVGSFTITR